MVPQHCGPACQKLNLDGKAFRPDGKTAATLSPYGLDGVNNFL